MKYVGNTNEYFELLNADMDNTSALDSPIEGQLSLVWFLEDGNKIEVDSLPHTFSKNDVICITSLHRLKINSIGKAKILRFNSPFYCILTHDSEVGCKGILFFGSKSLPVLKPNEDDIEAMDGILKMVQIEMKSRDNLQLEMLQMLLKRLLILCTRIYKTQENLADLPKVDADIVRNFSFLVEQHFKEKHTVSEYADLLNKSPKTLSNLFKKLHDKSPLRVIQNRIMLESRRLLRYTDKPISEIGYEVGFNDIQSFSRFFKKNEGTSPSVFRVG